MTRFILFACLAVCTMPEATPFPPARDFFREGPIYSEIYSAHTQPSPFAENQPLEKRARAYLSIHCSVCHQAGGVLQGSLDLRFNTPLPLTGLFALSNRQDVNGKSLNRARIRPGKPEDSDVYHRLRSTGKDAMPPLGRTSPDQAGLDLIRTWIVSLQSMTANQPAIMHTPSKQNPSAPKKVYRIMPANDARTCQTCTLPPAPDFFADSMQIPCRKWGLDPHLPMPRGRYEWLFLGPQQQEAHLILLVL